MTVEEGDVSSCWPSSGPPVDHIFHETTPHPQNPCTLKAFANPLYISASECAMLCLVAQLCPTLCNPMNCGPPGSSVHRDSPSKNTGVGCHALLQGIFPTQRLNPGLPHFREILYHLSHQGSPRQELVVSVNRKESRRERPSFSCAWDPLG